MIGNDIIDLSLAKTESNWQRPRFLEKQFTQNEIEQIHQSNNPFLQVWRFWSMKEAAYKVVAQQQDKRFFAPKKFHCEWLSETKGLVKFEDQTFESITQTTHKYIYTSIGKSTFQYLGLKTTQKEILQIIERNTGIPSTQLEIKKSTIGVPNVYQNGQLLSSSFTKTHHGDYQAFAFKSRVHYSEGLT